MRVLVTGGAGFIGSNLVDALIARGDEVSVIDDLSSGKASNLAAAIDSGARLHEVDVRDGAAVDTVFAEAKPELVFHLAAQMDVRRSLDDPAFDASVNVVGMINVLEAARRSGAQRLVNTSTGGAIYGETDVMPTPETVPPAPMSAYGLSKQCAEQYCSWAGRLYGLSTVTLRYGNVYGPRQDPSGEAGVVAIFAGRLLDGRRPTIYGDGEAIRDYTFVADIVRANLTAADQREASGAYNVGTGTESSVLDVVQALCEAAGPAASNGFEPEFEDARIGELQRSSLDVSRAREELGYVAETTLVEGMRATLEHLRALRGG